MEKIQKFLIDPLHADVFVTGPTLDAEGWLQSLSTFRMMDGWDRDRDGWFLRRF